MVNAIDKLLKLKIEFVSTRDLVASDRMTCIIACRGELFIIANMSLSLQIEFDV